jgi:hypothetical protein
MAARFTGSEGLRLLRDAMCRQPLVEGKEDVADKLARVSAVRPFDLGEVIIQQDGTDTGIFFHPVWVGDNQPEWAGRYSQVRGHSRR